MVTNATSTEANTESMATKKRYVTKTVYAPMVAFGEWKMVSVQVGSRTRTQRAAGFLKKEMVEVEVPITEERKEWVPNGKYSDVQIDHKELARMTEEAMNKLDE